MPPLRQRLGDVQRIAESYLSFFGPSGLILLIIMWAAGLIVGFALLLWGLGAQLATASGDADLGMALYGSGTTLFTLGLGDLRPDCPDQAIRVLR